MKDKKEWWEKPGFAVQFQIEARPGWLWNRNYNKFNASMMDENGNLKFDGPFSKMEDWVQFSKKVGVDYHIFECKWHDGICWWDTKYTNWKTPTDYCKILADESKKAGIPFMFYYSSIFDHNPQFDDIQPFRAGTPSYIAMHSRSKFLIGVFSQVFTIMSWLIRHVPHRIIRKIPHQEEDAKYLDDIRLNKYTYNPWKYEKYMLKQLIELIEKYKCDGLWMDWYQMNMEASADIVMDFMERKYPDIVLTFNNSIMWDLKWAHYLSSEAHNIKAAWKTANKYRGMKRPWEIICPAANYWDNPAARADPYEVARMAATLMACGGKAAFGIPSLMNGDLYPQPARHLEILGNWYKKRKELFTEAVPMKYRGRRVPGIKINIKGIGTIGAIQNDNNLIHIMNLFGFKKPITIEFSQKKWGNVEKIILEPSNKELKLGTTEKATTISLSASELDIVDTILRIIRK